MVTGHSLHFMLSILVYSHFFADSHCSTGLQKFSAVTFCIPNVTQIIPPPPPSEIQKTVASPYKTKCINFLIYSHFRKCHQSPTPHHHPESQTHADVWLQLD